MSFTSSPPPNPQRRASPLTPAVVRSAALYAALLAQKLALSVASLQIAVCLPKILVTPFIPACTGFEFLKQSFRRICVINDYCPRYVEDWKGVTWNTSKECGYVSLEELYAVIGLMYYRGMMQLNNTNVDRLFGGKDNVPMFGATMTKNRYENRD